MKIAGQLKARLGLDKKKYEKGLKGAKSSANKFGSAMKKIGGIIAAAFAIKIIARWGKAALNAYKEQRSAELKLAVIMRDRMKLGEDAFRRIVKQTGEYQKQGVIGDEIQLAGAQQLATFIKQEQALANMIPAMNNLLAQQKGYNAQAVDAVNIANMMGRVLTGQVSALSRVGISFTDVQEKILKTGTELEITATLAQVIADNVGNMNQELAKTDLGKIQSWNMFWGDMQEKLGKAIVPYLGDIAIWAKKSVPKIRDGIIDIVNAFIEWRNKIVGLRSLNKLMALRFLDFLMQINKGIYNVAQRFLFLGKLIQGQIRLKDIGEEWEAVNKRIIENEKEVAQTRIDLWNALLEEVSKQDKLWKKIGKSHGDAYVEGVGDVIIKPTRGITAPAKVPGKGITTTGTFAPADMTGAIERNKELARWMGVVAERAGELPVIGGLFEGMADSITSALAGTENTFDAFWKFFSDFIKGLIIKLIAATIAAFALSVALSAIGFTAKGATAPMKFGEIFGKGFKSFTGFGMAGGGEVPPGFPNDTYPALLTSRERVYPPDKLPSERRSGRQELITRISGRDLLILLRDADRANNNSF